MFGGFGGFWICSFFDQKLWSGPRAPPPTHVEVRTTKNYHNFLCRPLFSSWTLCVRRKSQAAQAGANKSRRKRLNGPQPPRLLRRRRIIFRRSFQIMTRRRRRREITSLACRCKLRLNYRYGVNCCMRLYNFKHFSVWCPLFYTVSLCSCPTVGKFV